MNLAVVEGKGSSAEESRYDIRHRPDRPWGHCISYSGGCRVSFPGW